MPEVAAASRGGPSDGEGLEHFGRILSQTALRMTAANQE
jgi:hypothetical protein